MSVNPKTFSKHMSKRWSDVLGNALTDNLPKAWELMAETLNQQIEGNYNKPVAVLPLPTGTGKTQGLCLYCSMLNMTGVLIVTELKDEVDNIANCINDLANKRIAIAEHGDNRNSPDEILQSQILVITHSAYQSSMVAEMGEEYYKSKWQKYSEWKGGRRKLTVVDEAINIVDDYSVTLEELRLLSSLTPNRDLNDSAQRAANIFNQALEYLSDLATKTLKTNRYELIQFPNSENSYADFKSLVSSIDEHIKSHFSYKDKDIDVRASLATYAKRILKNLQVITSSWSIYSQVGAYHRLTTARLVLPLELNHLVVLDATASANPVTRALEDHAELIKIPKVKSYKNLTINISVGHGVSKTATSRISTKEWSSIFEQLENSELKESRAPLLCVQKSTEDKIGLTLLPDAWEVIHWGAINGKNDWKHCDSVIVYGLPYLPEYICAATLMAFWDWSYKLKDKSYSKDILFIDLKYIQETYKWRHIIVSLVQAINRAHCRNMIEGGNCPETNVYVFVSTETDRDTLQHHLRTLLPDVDLKNWQAPKVEANSKGLNNTEQKIVDALLCHKCKAVDITVLLDDLSIKRRTFNNNYSKHLSKKQGKLYEATTNIGWGYLSGTEAKERLNIYKQHFVKLDQLQD